MRGYPQRTPELVAEAQRLRDLGLMWREVGERLGVPFQTAHMWATDPDGSKHRKRVEGYCGTCEVCGGATNGSSGPDRAPTVCKSCLTWTPEAVLEALRDWFEEFGEPPRVADTHGASRLPHTQTVAGCFGSWNAGLLAAGLPLVCDRRPERWEEIERRLRAGESTQSIADDMGCTPSNIAQMVYRRGLSLRDMRAAA